MGSFLFDHYGSLTARADAEDEARRLVLLVHILHVFVVDFLLCAYLYI